MIFVLESFNGFHNEFLDFIVPTMAGAFMGCVLLLPILWIMFKVLDWIYYHE